MSPREEAERELAAANHRRQYQPVRRKQAGGRKKTRLGVFGGGCFASRTLSHSAIKNAAYEETTP